MQRTTVNAVIAELSSEGLIATSRGTVRVIDRAGLKRRACECYERFEEHFAAVIGASGSGGGRAALTSRRIASRKVSPAWNGTSAADLARAPRTRARSSVTVSSLSGRP